MQHHLRGIGGIPGSDIWLALRPPRANPIGHHLARIAWRDQQRPHPRRISVGYEHPILPVMPIGLLMMIPGPIEGVTFAVALDWHRAIEALHIRKPLAWQKLRPIVNDRLPERHVQATTGHENMPLVAQHIGEIAQVRKHSGSEEWVV